MVITISGLDGAGKSSVIAGLKEVLEQQGHQVVVFHMNHQLGLYACGHGLYQVVQAVLRTARGSSRRNEYGEKQCQPPTGRRRCSSSSRSHLHRWKRVLLWNRPLRSGIYVLDLLIFMMYRLYLERLRKKIVVTDRYFYDRLVDVADGRRWLGLRLLARITPTPEVPVLLDVSPEEAFDRKGEYSLEYHRRRHTAYQTVFSWVSGAVVLTNSDLITTRCALVELVTERMEL